MGGKKTGAIRIGIGGWTYEPWRGSFYPDELQQKRELEYASRQLTSIEINGTYYGAQKPESFVRWYEETPDDFVFSVKAPRFVMNRTVLAGAGKSIERFFASGIMELKHKLGPINWQFLPEKTLDIADFEAFLSLLPRKAGGRILRHAVEVRHDSFQCAEFVELARAQGVAVVIAGDSKYPQIGDATAPFVYARIMGTTAKPSLGYSESALDAWAARIRAWATGTAPKGIGLVKAKAVRALPRDVYLYVIGGHKIKNPAAARSLIGRVTPGPVR